MPEEFENQANQGNEAEAEVSDESFANQADAGEGTDAPSASEDALTETIDELNQELELLKDLQRLQAEFVNYKARVERDRDLSRNNAIAEVIRAFLPALDDLSRAEAHGDLADSPFAAVATKLRAAGEKFGLQAFGAKGDAFDPEVHNALVQTESDEVTSNVIADVVESGYKLGDRLLRPAMVAVFIPKSE